MSTWRYLISNVRSTHRLLSTDGLITDRAIQSELRIGGNLLIKRETNLRKLWQTDTLFTTIPCLEMTTVPISECCSYIDNCEIARSKHKFPKIAEGNYQYVIQGVYSINVMSGKGKKLKEISINRYANLLKLDKKKCEPYYWITNDYLYITDPNVQAVRVVAYFEEEVPNEMLYPENGCGCTNNVTQEDLCKNPLDKDSPIPGYLEKQVIDLASTKLLNTYFRLKTDISNNGLDEQAANVNP